MPLVYGCGIYSDSDNLPHGSSLDDTVAANPRLRQLTGMVFTSVCLCVCLFFCKISHKSMQLGSPNLTDKIMFQDES